ncbi:MAG: GlsB/YeaQ/YmgE family stress response membrane protein [Alphaproteobacteria bacterium]
MPPIGQEAIIILLVIGIVMGWLGGLITRGNGFGNIVNIVLAIGGAFLGYYMLNYFGVQVGKEPIGLGLTGIFGSVVVLFLASRLRRKRG